MNIQFFSQISLLSLLSGAGYFMKHSGAKAKKNVNYSETESIILEFKYSV